MLYTIDMRFIKLPMINGEEIITSVSNVSLSKKSIDSNNDYCYYWIHLANFNEDGSIRMIKVDKESYKSLQEVIRGINGEMDTLAPETAPNVCESNMEGLEV
jgi:hypothetical protein